MRKHKFAEISNMPRDKSPVIQVNLMKQKENKQQQKTPLNLSKMLENKKLLTDASSLWDPADEVSNASCEGSLRMNTSTIDDNIYVSYLLRQSRLPSKSIRTLHTNRSKEQNSYRHSVSPPRDKVNDLQCPFHLSRGTRDPRRVTHVCCLARCQFHVLCSECQIRKEQCQHQNILKLEDFQEHPILVFLQQGLDQEISNEVIQQLIMQQNHIYSKVQHQAQESKQQLSHYFDDIKREFNAKIELIKTQFEEAINSQLAQIKENVEQLQNICITYKQQFQSTQTQTHNLKAQIVKFKNQSDDPMPAILEMVKRLQDNLTKMPQLQDTYQFTMPNICYHNFVV